jgi:ABC-type multidrug transport system fused ATPase/permease subunit
MKNKISWLVVNIGTYVLFILGNLSIVSTGFLSIAVFVYWIGSLVSLMFYSDTVAESIYKDNKNWARTFNREINIAVDIIVMSTMVYFGYIWLPVCYLIGNIGSDVFEKNYNKLKMADKIRPREDKDGRI